MAQTIQTISLLGAGWLGTPLGERLVQDGYTVKGSTTRAERFPELEEKGIQPYRIRITGAKIEAEQDFADFFNCDLLLINVPPGRRQPDVASEYPQRIKTINMLAQAHEVKQTIFVSSTSVYGNTNNLVTEEDEEAPASASGEAVLTAERYLGLMNNPQATILRMGGLVGGDRKPGRFLAGKQNLKNGQAPVNLVHLEDCIGVCREVIKQQKWGEIYNVVADEHPTREAFYPAQAKKLGLHPPTFLPDPEPSFKVISNRKVKQDLGYTFFKPDPMLF